MLGKSPPPDVLNGAPLLERVEKMLRAPLKDNAFELDGEDTRRYLQFTNGVFDRDTMTFVENEPAIRVTNCTGWAWEGSKLIEETEASIEQALLSVAEDESRGCAYVSAETRDKLESLCKDVPDLNYL